MKEMKKEMKQKQVNIITNSINLFNIYIYVPAGSIYEKDKIRGISHLLEHMLMKRTKNYTNKGLSSEITKIGGISNAGTSKDVTYYYIKTHIDNYKTAVKIMSDIIHSPVFLNEELATEKKIVLEEFAKNKDDIDSILDIESTRNILGNQNEYSYPIIGTQKDISSITISDLKTYIKKHYSNYMVLVNCDKKYLDEVTKYIYMHFSKDTFQLPDESTLKYINHVNKSGEIYCTNNSEYSQYKTVLSFITYPVTDINNIIKFNFIKYILTSSGFNSILFSEIREKRGLVYSISSYNEDNRYNGIYKIVFSSTNPNTPYIISIILSCLQNLITKGLSENKIKYYKKSFLNRTKYIFSNEDVKEMWYGNLLFYNIPITYEEYLNKIKAIKNEDIMKISKEIFNFKHMGVATHGKYTNNAIIKDIQEIKDTYYSLLN